MKQWGIFLLIILGGGLLLRLPHPGTDIAHLEPVEVVQVRQMQTQIEVTTDTGAAGHGDTLAQAVEDMKEHAMGEIFLDTADYLLLDLHGLEIEELYPLFRPGCKVCNTSGIDDLETAGVYLQTHEPEKSLLRICAEPTELEELVQTEGGMVLVREKRDG